MFDEKIWPRKQIFDHERKYVKESKTFREALQDLFHEIFQQME